MTIINKKQQQFITALIYIIAL